MNYEFEGFFTAGIDIMAKKLNLLLRFIAENV